MSKKLLVICVLGMLLLTSLTVTGINFVENTDNNIITNLGTKEETRYDEMVFLPVMRADNEFLKRWEEDYSNAEEAFINPTLTETIQTTSEYSILDLLYYIPEERTQGRCGNCWAWPSTSIIEIALRVQENEMENRLSIQYINTCGELYTTFPGIECCGGGTLSMLASFYSQTGRAIPWSNKNAHWQDHVTPPLQCNVITCQEISKLPNYPISSIRARRIPTRNIPMETAIDNIKNILHQNRGVYFSVMYADNKDLNNFRNFWRNDNEEVIYDLDHYSGNPWVDGEGVGHALLIVGYGSTEDNDYWVILNSWGTTEGRPNGLMRANMNMDYSLSYSGVTAFGAETLNLTFGSEAPSTEITGPSIGRKNTEHTYQVWAVDPQEDDVYLFVNWGEGTNTDWMGPYESGEVIEVSHSWSEQETFNIRAKAKDIHGNEGKEARIPVTVPATNELSIPMQFLFRNNIYLFEFIFELLQPFLQKTGLLIQTEDSLYEHCCRCP